MGGSRSLRLQVFRSPQSLRRPRRHSSFSAGSLSSPAAVSITMPKKVTQVEGPSHLWAASDTPGQVRAPGFELPNAEQHSTVPGAPSTTKSSK